MWDGDFGHPEAIGVNRWGKREVLGVSVGLSEAQVHWREFLLALQQRGLEGIQLLVSDDHVGLRSGSPSLRPLSQSSGA